MTNRILIFSPYACRHHLTAYEGTIANACQIRGATVEYVLCDGLLAECDTHWDSFPDTNAPRPFHLCQSCQSRTKRNFASPEFNLPHQWLGEFVSESERLRAFDWAQSLPHSEIHHASFMGYPLGEWVQSSMVSYFRQYPPDMSNWRVVNVYRGFIFSAAIVAIGLRNYLNKYSVESALLFNGRASITRVAFEIFRQLGIRVLTHETPFYQRGHLMVKPNARCWSIEPFTEFWLNWGHVPLARPALEMTLNWLKKRRYGQGLSWYAFNNPYLRSLSVRNELNLSQDKRLLALFTSSTDETAGDPELQGPFESQSSWVQDVISWVTDRNDVELVIRVHPHLAGTTGLGRAVDEFDFYSRMKTELPDNIRIIMPDDSLNSYALMDVADICLSFGSSVGIEMAMLGKPVVLASRGFYECGSQILTVDSKESLPEMLEKSLQPPSSREIRREAFRLAYYYVFKFELPFPLVSMVDVMNANLNYSSSKALAPGKDDTLDHICNYLIFGEPLFDSPTEAEHACTTSEEDTFFAELEQSSEPLRDMKYERWLQQTSRLNRIGRSVQIVLKSLPLGAGNFLNRIGKSTYLVFLYFVGKKNELK
jgi:hypothetical protein